jgi:GAF domain-containing protein
VGAPLCNVHRVALSKERQRSSICLLIVARLRGGIAPPLTWESPSIELDFLLAIIAYVLAALWVTLPAIYAAQFARSKPIGSTIVALGIAMTGYGILCAELKLAGVWTGRFELPDIFMTVVNLGVYAGGPLLLIAAVFAAAREHRARIAWLAIALVPWQLAYAMAGQFGAQWLWYAGEVWAFFGPLLLTYAILSRRTVDVGFVLNRAVVFSGVSLVLLGAFVLVEWLLTDFLSAESRTANVAVTAAIAVGLGLSVRFIHARIERVVDRVFFARRHAAEQAIRAFAQDAPYVTDERVLLERSATVLEHATNAEFVNVLTEDGNGYAGIDENDPAIVRLRSTRRPVDLHEVSTAVDGEIAFPMGARGRLLGIIVLGPQTSGEAFAPDEVEAIAALSHSVGIAFDNLQARNGSSNATIEQALTGIRQSIEALRGEMRRAEP